MCFSATASFSAGTLLLGAGTLTLKSAKNKSEWMFASIPLLFAIQQLSEGVIWLTFSYEAPLLNTIMTYVFSLFSHVLWPIYVPIAVLLIEPSNWRRKTLLGFIIAGVLVGLYLLYFLMAFPVIAQPMGKHIEYVSPHFFAIVAMSLYLMSTTVSLFMTSHRSVQVFGVLALIAFVVAYVFYKIWFISVWCFFSALLSMVIYFHFYFAKCSSEH